MARFDMLRKNGRKVRKDPLQAKQRSFRGSRSYEASGNARRKPSGLKLWIALAAVSCGCAHAQVVYKAGQYDQFQPVVIRYPKEGRDQAAERARRAQEAQKRAQEEKLKAEKALKAKEAEARAFHKAEMKQWKDKANAQPKCQKKAPQKAKKEEEEPEVWIED